MTRGFCACLVAVVLPACAQQLQKAKIGDLKLRNGETIRDCTIGYRTFGTLNADRTNAVLFPSWFSGTTEDLVVFVGPNKLIDSRQYFVIAVDALGNGITSSPSNSASQPRMRFPKFSIRDMVESQHLLLTEKLGISHVRAVIGVSMGGMQAFQWAVSYADFMDFIIPIVASPRPTSYDLLLATAEEHAIQDDDSWQHGEYADAPDGMKVVAAIHALTLQTPAYWVEHTPRERFDDVFRGIEGGSNKQDANNWLRQVQAVIGHDITRDFGGSLQTASAAIRAKMLIVVNLQDHMVNPQPAQELAHIANARLLELNDNLGHASPGVNMKRIGEAVAELLGRKQ